MCTAVYLPVHNKALFEYELIFSNLRFFVCFGTFWLSISYHFRTGQCVKIRTVLLYTRILQGSAKIRK